LEFEAVIVATRVTERGIAVVLDRSAFYPTSGGQSNDIGALNGVPVTDVVEDEDGSVLHLCAGEVGPAGTTVTGQVNKARRRRNCQSHTAQHILSAAFARLFEFVTKSVHLGEEYAAIELETPSISAEQLAEAEKWANQAVADNVAVQILFVDASEAARLPLRKPPQRAGRLRIIRIGDIDCTACGGTHCATSGGVGLVKIIGVEKIRGRALVKFLCGELAAEDYRRRFDATDRLTRSLTCNVVDLPAKIDKLTADLRSLRQDLMSAQRELLPARAAELVVAAETRGDLRLVVASAESVEPALAGTLACDVSDRIGGPVVLLSGGKLVLAAPEQSSLHAGKLARELAERAGLKGGGNQRVAQIGGAAPADLAAYRSHLLAILGGHE